MSRHSDRRQVAVVGGGAVGCAVAYQLARSGCAVTLIERNSLAAHASGQNAGNLNPLHGTPPAMIPSTLEAFRVHAEVRSELAQLGCANCQARPVNRLHLGFDEADLRQLKETAALFSGTEGFSSNWLNRDELGRIEPRLADEIERGLLTTGGLSIDGGDFTRSLAEGAMRLGANLVHATVSGIAASGGRVTALLTDHGRLACDEIVFATGPWTAETESWLGIELDVKPVKGQLLLLQMPGATPCYDFTWRSICLYQRRENEVWLGGTMEERGFDCTPAKDAREFLLESAARIVPRIRNATVLDHIAALRPVSQMPIAMRAEGWQNVYIANGGGYKGILLSVGIARAIRDLLADDSGDVAQN
jgi:glycine oxidase